MCHRYLGDDGQITDHLPALNVRLTLAALAFPFVLMFAYPLGFHHFVIVGFVLLKVRRRQAVPLLVIAAVGFYGVAIAGDWALAFWSQPGRRYGGVDWALWAALAVVLPSVVRTEARWRSALVFLAMVCAVYSGSAVIETVWREVAGLPPARVSGLATNPGFLSVWAASGVLLGAHLLRAQRTRAAGLTLVAVSMLALYGSGTRSSMLGVVCGLPFVFTLARSRFLAGSIGVGLLGLWAWVTGRVGAAVETMTDDRMRVWAEAARGTAERPWGYGWYSFLDRGFLVNGVPYDAPHSIPLHLAYELGLIGVVVVLAAGWLLTGLRGPWRALVVGWAVYGLFWLPSPAWWVIGVLLVARVLSVKQHQYQQGDGGHEPDGIAHPQREALPQNPTFWNSFGAG